MDDFINFIKKLGSGIVSIISILSNVVGILGFFELIIKI